MPSPAVTGYFDAHVHQGHFGEGFVRVLAAAAGLAVSSPDPPTGVDLQIAAPGPRGTQRSPKIEVQVKSWSVPDGTVTTWRYPLKNKNYNELAGEGFDVRRYLVLCVVPADPTQYAHATVERLRLSHCAYWASLENLTPDPTLDPTSRTTIDVPKVNVLTVGTLSSLLLGDEENAVVAA